MTLSRQIYIAFSLLAAVIVTFVLTALWGAMNIISTQKIVSHTLEVLDSTDQITKSLDEAENGLRGYVITDNNSFLIPFRQAQATLDKKIDELAKLTSDNPSQQLRIQDLGGRVNVALAYLQRAVEKSDRSNPGAAVNFVNDPQGNQFMAEAHDILSSVEQEENSLLESRLAKSRETMHTYFVRIAVGALFIALILLFEMRNLVKAITVPIRQLAKDAARFGRGETDSIPTIEGKNEISALSKSINEMARQRKQIELRANASEEAARRAARAREDLLAIVSHDLKNPLAVINLSAELLDRRLSREGTNADIRGRIESIVRSSGVMSTLINDLLQAAAIEAGKFQVNKKTSDLKTLIEETRSFFSPLAADKQITLICETETPRTVVTVDYERVRQALFNIVGNAIKFTPNGGSVCVFLRSREGYIDIAVEDTGPGIKRDEIPKLFDRYYRAKGTKKEGTGLGLFIAKGVVEAHGGRILVESPPTGGSRFILVLPESSADASTAVSSAREAAEPAPPPF